MQNDDALTLDRAYSQLLQVKDLLDMGEDELHEADRGKSNGSRNRELDKGHNLVKAAQRLLDEIVDDLGGTLDEPASGGAGGLRNAA